MLLLLAALPLDAADDISFDPAITQAEFAKFSRLIAQGIYASPVQPAGSAGLLRFDIGVVVSGVSVDTNAAYWQRAVGNDFSMGSYVAVPRLVVSKGYGAGSISGSYAKLQDTGISILGGSLDIPIIDGGLLKPTLALRGAYSTLRGIDAYDMKVYGLELFLGKGFGPLTPYAAVGRQRHDAQGIIPPTAVSPQIVLNDKGDINRYTVGLRFSLLGPKVTVEANQAEERSYAAKISFGF